MTTPWGRRFDHLAGIEAQILAEARRQDLHARAQTAMVADRHRQRRNSEQRRDQADADRIHHARRHCQLNLQ
jgi:hypothetical protein